MNYSNDPNCKSSAVGGFYVVGDVREIHAAAASTYIVEFNVETQIASEQRGLNEKKYLLNALKTGGTFIPPDHERRFMESGILEYLPKSRKQFVRIEKHGNEISVSKHVDTFVEALSVDTEFNFYADPENFHKYFEFIQKRTRAELWDLTPLPSAPGKTVNQQKSH